MSLSPAGTTVSKPPFRSHCLRLEINFFFYLVRYNLRRNNRMYIYIQRMHFHFLVRCLIKLREQTAEFAITL